MHVCKWQCRRSYVPKFKSLLYFFHIWLVRKQLCLPRPPQDLWPSSLYLHSSSFLSSIRCILFPTIFTYTFTFSCTSSSLISVSWSPEVSTLIVPSFNFHPSPYMPLTTCFKSVTHNCLLNSTTTIIPSVLPSLIFSFAVSSTPFPSHPVFINHHPFGLFPFLSLFCATWSFLQQYHEKQDFHNVKISPQFTILLENRLQKWTNQKWLWLWGHNL